VVYAESIATREDQLLLILVLVRTRSRSVRKRELDGLDMHQF
jgi:hypothetical protein